MKQLKMLLLTSMFTLFSTYAHAVPVNMAPIISYLLSDTQQLSLSGQTKYFATTLGATGFRTYAEDGTYTASITLYDGTTIDTNGTYYTVGSVITLNRTSPAPATLVLTYFGEEAGGIKFDVTVNGGVLLQSISFATEAERDIFVKSFESDVMPIFVGNCSNCHNTGSQRIFQVSDAANTYTNIKNNTLINTISPDLSSILIYGNGGDGHSRGDKLSDDNSQIVRDWIWQSGLEN